MAGTYVATVVWRCGEGEHFPDHRYSRAHDWLFDGGARVRASASPRTVSPPLSDPSAVDPEEALVAALSSCHMLFFLWLAAQRGFSVLSYEDAASGTMSQGPDGREWITGVTLQPKVIFDGQKRPTKADVDALHDESHERCYIANSVRTEIVVQARAEGTL